MYNLETNAFQFAEIFQYFFIIYSPLFPYPAQLKKFLLVQYWTAWIDFLRSYFLQFPSLSLCLLFRRFLTTQLLFYKNKIYFPKALISFSLIFDYILLSFYGCSIFPSKKIDLGHYYFHLLVFSTLLHTCFRIYFMCVSRFHGEGPTIYRTQITDRSLKMKKQKVS